MKSCFIIIMILMCFPIFAQANSEAYTKYLEAAAEAETNQNLLEAIKQYRKATEVASSSIDKSEAFLQLVNLQLDSKESGKKDLLKFENWLKAHPQKKEQILPWLKTVKSHFDNNLDVSLAPPMMKTWAYDQKVKELIVKKRFKEAWELIKVEPRTDSPINTKVQYDLLAASQGIKKELQCSPTLKKFPNAQAWNMKVCRYLEQKKLGKTQKNIAKEIEKQIEIEDPTYKYLITLVSEI